MEKKGLYEEKEMKWNNGMRHGKGRRSYEMLWGITYNKTMEYYGFTSSIQISFSVIT